MKNKNDKVLFPPTDLLVNRIDALADAINDFPGGLVLVSHDFRLIEQVASEIWLVGLDGKITHWDGDIRAYKDLIIANYEKKLDGK